MIAATTNRIMDAPFATTTNQEGQPANTGAEQENDSE